jgi:hypothetical protein
VDEWNPSWRDFHFGYGSVGGICAQSYGVPGGASPCFGVRLTMDLPVSIVGPSTDQRVRGFPSGFELGDATERQWQPMTLLGVRRDGANTTLQLNVTFAPYAFANGSSMLSAPAAGFIRYSWHDYPTMVVYGLQSGRPLAPFMVAMNGSTLTAD